MSKLALAALCLVAMLRVANASPTIAIEAGPVVQVLEPLAGVGASIGSSQRIAGNGIASAWLHESVAHTNLTGYSTGEGSATRIDAGVEWQVCKASGVTCLLLGVSGGYLRGDFVGTHQLLFGGAVPVEEHYATPTATARIGLDTGTDSVRFRPVLDIYGGSHAAGGQLGGTVAWLW